MYKYTIAYKAPIVGAALTLLGSITYATTQGSDPHAMPKGQLLEVPVLRSMKQHIPAWKTHKLVKNFLEEGFENGALHWNRTGSWQIGLPTNKLSKNYNPSNVAATNRNGNYFDAADDSLTSPQIRLQAANGETLSLIFDEWYQIESGYDAGQVEISTNAGQTWTTLETRSGSSSWRESEVDLTSYAGKDASIRFRLTSDESINYPGWYVDNVQVVKATPAALTTSIASLNHQSFPFIFMDVDVTSTTGTCPAVIPQSSFIVRENNVVQSDYFEVTPPNQGGGVRLADVVFIMDNSGSMGDEQAAVKQNVFAFVDGLNRQGADDALGLTRYGAAANGGAPIIEDNGSPTSNPTYFKNTVWARNVVNGGFEPGYQAIVKTASSFQFRPGAARYFIIITDELPAQGSVTLQNAKTALTTSGATLFVLTTTSLFSYYTALVDNPANQIFNITSPFNQILTAIANQVASTYLVRYRSSNPAFNGLERLVQVDVTCGSNTSTGEYRYTPGSAPKIVLTSNTLALNTQAQIANSALTIGANVTDAQAPLVTGTTLYYRTHGTTLSSYTAVAMPNAGGTLYQTQIPAAKVVAPGLDYYVTATDGTSVSSSPTTSPADAPYQISILPNQPPTITHTSVVSGLVGDPLPITAEIVDTTNSLTSASLNYRQFGNLVYNKVLMTAGANNSFSATIPATEFTNDGVQYFISAIDNFGLGGFAGTPDAPIYIQPAYTVNSVAGTNGSVAPNVPQLVIRGNTTAFTVTPNSGYTLDSTVTGNCPQGTWNNNVWTTGVITTHCTVNFSFTAIPPTATTKPATDVTATSATLNGQIDGNGFTTTVDFDFGTTTNYGTTLSANPSSLYGSAAVTANATGLTCNTDYHYRVKAVSSAGTSDGSNQSFKTLPYCLSPPVINTALPGNTKVTLKWTVVTDATSYNVYQGTTAGGEGTSPVKTLVTGNKVDITGLTNGITYFFKMKSVNANGQSELSNEVSAKPVIPLLPPIVGSAIAGNAKVTLKWSTVKGATSYNVYQGTTAGGESTIPVKTGVTGNVVTITNLTNGTTYYFKMSAESAVAASPLSNEVSAKPILPPDFVITSITLTPQTMLTKSVFSANVVIKNQGAGANAGKLSVWTNRATPQTCSAIGDKVVAVGTVASGASQNVTISGLIAGSVGAKNLHAFVDSACTIAESNESNNQFAISYTVK